MMSLEILDSWKIPGYLLSPGSWKMSLDHYLLMNLGYLWILGSLMMILEIHESWKIPDPLLSSESNKAWMILEHWLTLDFEKSLGS